MSMLLANIFEGLITFLSNLLIDIVTLLMNAIIALFGELLFGLVLKVLYFVDFFQSLFKRLVGLDTVWIGDNASNSDIVLALITSSQVMDVFVALTVLAIVIMFIATIIQIIRSEYTTEKSENNKTAIFKNSLKSMAMFVIVPLAVVMGIILSQFLLKALDTATTKTNSSKISNSVFSASCSSANKLIVSDKEKAQQLYPVVTNNTVVWNYKHNSFKSGQVFLGYKINLTSDTISLQQIPSTPVSDVTESVSYEQNMASIIDNCFASGYYIIVAESEDDLFNNEIYISKDSMAYKFATEAKLNLTLSSDGRYLVGEKQADGTLKLNVFDATNSNLAVQFYDTNSINYVILAFGTFICAYIMLMSAIGIVMRLFKSVLLYVVAPPVVGLMPLDGGNAFGEWKKAFIANILSAYGTIIALNLFFLMLPFFQSINFFNSGNAIQGIDLSFQNSLMRLILVITGLITVKEGGALISKLIGVDDAIATGGDMSKRIGKTLVNAATVATGVGALAKAAATKSASFALKAGAKIGDKIDEKRGRTTSDNQIRNRGRARALANKLDEKTAYSMANFKTKRNAIGKQLGEGLGFQMREKKNIPVNAVKAKKQKDKAKAEKKKYEAVQSKYAVLKAKDEKAKIVRKAEKDKRKAEASEEKKKYIEKAGYKKDGKFVEKASSYIKGSLSYYKDKIHPKSKDKTEEKPGKVEAKGISEVKPTLKSNKNNKDAKPVKPLTPEQIRKKEVGKRHYLNVTRSAKARSEAKKKKSKNHNFGKKKKSKNHNFSKKKKKKK